MDKKFLFKVTLTLTSDLVKPNAIQYFLLTWYGPYTNPHMHGQRYIIRRCG